MILLETRDLTLSIAGQSICSGLNLRLEAGQCWGLLGRNGAGKTTLLHTLSGLHKADSGDILLEGQSLADLSRRQIARRLGLLLQDNEARFPLNVAQAVLNGRHPHLGLLQNEGTEDRRLASEALAAVGMENFAHRTLDTLSGGERQRVAIATLLTQAPRVMLLDEPTNHLDLHRQLGMLALLKAHQREGAILMSLHDINLALRFCDHLILLQEGGCRFGPTSELASDATLSQLYGHRLVSVAGPRGPVIVPE